MQIMIRTLFVLSLIPVIDSVFSQHAYAPNGKIIIRHVPGNAQIAVNDSVVFHSGDAVFELAPGRYHIAIANPLRMNARHLDFDTTVVVRSGMTSEISCRFRELIRIESDPFGAAVYNKGIKIGDTPLWMDFSGPADLLFIKKGYEEKSVRLDDSGISAGQFQVQLKKSSFSTPENPNLFKNAEWQKRGEKRFQTPLFAALSLAVISGSAAAYTKKKADDYFEDAKLAYLFSDFEKQKRLEKKTRRYDRYATIGYIGMQVNIVAAVYFLFRMN